jgi:type VI secretion system secreted protein VgrG
MVAGTHTAMVRGPGGEEIHTDTHGRFRAQLHWDREAVGSDEDSRWVRKLQEVSTSMGLARVGWEMFLSHIDGDPDRPVGVGRAINGVAIPTYALPNNKNMMSIKTPSSPQSGGFNELSMDDSAGSQAISMRAEKDLDALVKNDKSEVIGNNETHTVGVDFVRQVTGNQTISIGGNSDATYGKSYSLNIQLDRDKKVGGSEKVDVGGASDSAVAGSDSESVGIMRITVAGSFKMPDIEAMAKSAAMQFVRGVSPGATALYDKAKGAYDTVQGMSEGGSLEDKVKDTVKGYVEDTVKDAAKDAGKAAFDAIKGGKGLDGAVDAAGTSLEGSYDEQKGKVDGLMGGVDSQISGLKDNFNNLAPTQETFNSSLQGAASTLTGGLSDSLSKGDYGLALNQAVDLFCIGSISRAVEGNVLKLVGGCFVTASLRDITWDIGYGYAELVGGVKLTSVQGSITQSVEKCLLTLVGGTVIRTSTGNLTISSKASSVMVGGAATYASTAKLELKGTNITLDAGVSLILEGGGGQVVMTPGDVTISGDLNLKAGGKVATTAALIDITE